MKETFNITEVAFAVKFITKGSKFQKLEVLNL